MCLADDPLPVTNGELAEQWIDCRQCVEEYRIRMGAIAKLAECRIMAEPLAVFVLAALVGFVEPAVRGFGEGVEGFA